VPQKTWSVKRLEVNEIFWREQRHLAGALPAQHVAQEILWELFELNSRAHPPTGAMSDDDKNLFLERTFFFGVSLVASLVHFLWLGESSPIKG